MGEKHNAIIHNSAISKTVGESFCPSLKNNSAKQKDLEDVKKGILLCSALQWSTEQNTLRIQPK